MSSRKISVPPFRSLPSAAKCGVIVVEPSAELNFGGVIPIGRPCRRQTSSRLASSVETSCSGRSEGLFAVPNCWAADSFMSRTSSLASTTTMLSRKC